MFEETNMDENQEEVVIQKDCVDTQGRLKIHPWQMWAMIAAIAAIVVAAIMRLARGSIPEDAGVFQEWGWALLFIVGVILAWVAVSSRVRGALWGVNYKDFQRK